MRELRLEIDSCDALRLRARAIAWNADFARQCVVHDDAAFGLRIREIHLELDAEALWIFTRVADDSTAARSEPIQTRLNFQTCAAAFGKAAARGPAAGRF